MGNQNLFPYLRMFTLLKHVSLPVLVFFSWPRCVPPKQHAASRGTILFTLTWSIFIALGADVRYGWPSTCCLDVHEHPKTKKGKNAQLASASVFLCSINPDVITSIP